jgi:hypothetical protein
MRRKPKAAAVSPNAKLDQIGSKAKGITAIAPFITTCTASASRLSMAGLIDPS